jgi:dTDP-glucose 4,6-dehydratase
LKLVITGGAGFIGRNLVTLIEDKYEKLFSSIIVFDALTYAGTSEDVFNAKTSINHRFIRGDIRNLEEISLASKGADVLINFAAESHVDRSLRNPSIFLETNSIGAFNVFEACRKNEISKVVHISTDEVYGSVLEGMSNEDDRLLPNSPYSASKASADLIGRSMFETFKLPIVITRCTNNYGNYQHPEKMIPMFITELLEDRRLPIYGNGENIREWISVRDHCEGILAALKYGKSGEIYNIGSGAELSNIEVARSILDEMNASESKISYVEDRLGHDFRYRLNFEKSKNELNYLPQVDFAPGLRDTIEWYISNQNWWKPLKHAR